ncbi:MAG TPA: hypothetical protein QF468_07800 [Nitrospinota bacterium]|jgi:tetratricopeptide (TPR) repeat protein|nr:hypothetical protein [Nitrospinota bacterium]|tara:strand:+ start:250 stop:711 length:462 start_codon:yes stop_codon:yes gene_type:complete
MKWKFNTISTIILVTGLFFIIAGLSQNIYAGNSDVDYNALSWKAEDLNAKQKHQEVIDLLKPYAEDKKNKSGYFFNELGTAYFSKQDNLNANKYFAIAHQLKKNDPKIIYNLASSLALLENYKEALKLFNLAESKGFDKRFIKEWRIWLKGKM